MAIATFIEPREGDNTHLWGSDYLEPGMVVLGDDGDVVGQIAQLDADVISVHRTPLPMINLPIGLISRVHDGVVILGVSGQSADLMGDDELPIHWSA
jgi:hypothetical protein